MLFNSIDFAVFFPVVFIAYWSLNQWNLNVQNSLIVVASYFFYGMWDWRFLSLILFSTVVDYGVGLALANNSDEKKRRAFLAASVVVNLGFLGFFKYCNFFIDNFSAAFTLFGKHIETGSLNIVLPVGISFYTFQTLSYSIDVYRKKLEPTRDFISFAAFVSFFPQLVAGPIERATHLLPQFYTKRTFCYTHAVDGLRQILWGLFKKVVIADNCATFANEIFNHSGDYGGSSLLLGALFFSFQIYGDFSGYSDIAIGTSRLLGFDLMQNFAFPYFSRDIAEFWRRWHISLSTWFRDYVYIPLGGSRGSTLRNIRNIFIIFLVSGFWHGANWTFILWGGLNAFYFFPLLLTNRNRHHLETVASGKRLPSLNELIRMGSTFSLTVFAWIFFRADSVRHALAIISEIFSPSLFNFPKINSGTVHAAITFCSLLFFIGIEWMGRENHYALERFGFTRNRWIRRLFYVALSILILLLAGKQQEFIYFQF